MQPFHLWMRTATTSEQQKLAEEAGVSRGYLYQLASDVRNGSAAVAGRIAEAAERLRLRSRGRLPKITRADVSKTCAECEYAQCILRRME